MYNNAGHFVKKVKEDSLSNFLESLSFRVNGYGRFLQQDVSSFRQFFCNDMEFILIARGSSVLYTLDQTHRLTPGTLILLKPFQLYTAICQPGEKLYYYYIHFDVQPSHLTESYLKMISGDEMALVVPPGELPGFLPAFAGMQNDWRNESPGLMALIRSYLAILTVHLERRIQRDPSLTISGRPEGNYNLDMLSKALEYITGHLDEPFKLEDLCRHLGISRAAFISYSGACSTQSRAITLPKPDFAKRKFCCKQPVAPSAKRPSSVAFVPPAISAGSSKRLTAFPLRSFYKNIRTKKRSFQSNVG